PELVSPVPSSGPPWIGVGGAAGSSGPDGGGPCGAPGPPTGANASWLRCTDPSGDLETKTRCASVEPNVRVCAPTGNHLTVLTTLTDSVSGPMRTGCASSTVSDPPPSITWSGSAVGTNGGNVPALIAVIVGLIF